MSTARHQGLIEGRLEDVWRLVGDPNRHPEWWPKVMEVRGGAFAAGDTYRQVTALPLGRHETTIEVERLEDLREIRTRCVDTGMYADWRFTEAREATFVDVEMGMEPAKFRYRVMDAATGNFYFRRWLEETVEQLRAAVEGGPDAERPPTS
jgi:hypothetical protein